MDPELLGACARPGEPGLRAAGRGRDVRDPAVEGHAAVPRAQPHRNRRPAHAPQRGAHPPAPAAAAPRARGPVAPAHSGSGHARPARRAAPRSSRDAGSTRPPHLFHRGSLGGQWARGAGAPRRAPPPPIRDRGLPCRPGRAGAGRRPGPFPGGGSRSGVPRLLGGGTPGAGSPRRGRLPDARPPRPEPDGVLDCRRGGAEEHVGGAHRSAARRAPLHLHRAGGIPPTRALDAAGPGAADAARRRVVGRPAGVRPGRAGAPGAQAQPRVRWGGGPHRRAGDAVSLGTGPRPGNYRARRLGRAAAGDRSGARVPGDRPRRRRQARAVPRGAGHRSDQGGAVGHRTRVAGSGGECRPRWRHRGGDDRPPGFPRQPGRPELETRRLHEPPVTSHSARRRGRNGSGRLPAQVLARCRPLRTARRGDRPPARRERPAPPGLDPRTVHRRGGEGLRDQRALLPANAARRRLPEGRAGADLGEAGRLRHARRGREEDPRPLLHVRREAGRPLRVVLATVRGPAGRQGRVREGARRPGRREPEGARELVPLGAPGLPGGKAEASGESRPGGGGRGGDRLPSLRRGGAAARHRSGPRQVGGHLHAQRVAGPGWRGEHQPRGQGRHRARAGGQRRPLGTRALEGRP